MALPIVFHKVINYNDFVALKIVYPDCNEDWVYFNLHNDLYLYHEIYMLDNLRRKTSIKYLLFNKLIIEYKNTYKLTQQSLLELL